MNKWNKEVPKENWKKWWVAYISHMGTGAIASIGILLSPKYLHPLAILAFILLPVLVVCRQTLEFLRRNDTPGRDLKHHLMGYTLGIAIGVIIIRKIYLGGIIVDLFSGITKMFGFKKNKKTSTIDIEQGPKGRWRWFLRNKNGETVALSPVSGWESDQIAYEAFVDVASIIMEVDRVIKPYEKKE